MKTTYTAPAVVAQSAFVFETKPSGKHGGPKGPKGPKGPWN